MAKRVGVILSGCGRFDGSDVAETMLVLLVLERAGAEAVCVAPDVELPAIVDHSSRRAGTGKRNARIEAARIIGGPVRPLGDLNPAEVDGLIVPGGMGAVTTLSDYAVKAELCQVQVDVVRLLKALLQARRPMGFLGLSALLAARVLGPLAGVRLTLGSKGTPAAKHAAIMGADVRPCTDEDVIADQKSRVFSTPGFLAEAAHLAGVARAVDRLVRAVVASAKDRNPVGRPEPLPVETTGPSRGSA